MLQRISLKVSVIWACHVVKPPTVACKIKEEVSCAQTKVQNKNERVSVHRGGGCRCEDARFGGVRGSPQRIRGPFLLRHCFLVSA